MIVICLGCSANVQVQQTSETISPTSYKVYKGHVRRSVGLLRRLVLVPPKYTYVYHGKRKPEWEAKAGQVLGEWARQFLKNWRGYEIFSCGDSMIGSTMSSKACSVEDKLLWQSFFKWTDTSPIDAVPPENLIKLIKDISEHVAADGIVVIQGYQELPKFWFSKDKSEIKVDILESATGRLVWKNRLNRISPGRPLEQQEVKNLLAPVEFAVPFVLID